LERLGEVWRGLASVGEVRRGLERFGEVRRGLERFGEVRRGLERVGEVRRGLVGNTASWNCFQFIFPVKVVTCLNLNLFRVFDFNVTVSYLLLN